MTIEEILDKVDHVEKKTNYWFIRTDHGKHFEDFTKGEYIAIGWDYFTLDELQRNDKEYIKRKIAFQEKLDQDNTTVK